MAYVADTVIVELQAKLDDYNKNVLNAVNTFEKGMDKISKSALKAEQQALRSSTAISNAFKGIGGAMLISKIQGMADAWTDYSARVGLAIKEMDMAPVVMERLYDMAQRTYSAFDQTAESFLSNASTLQALGRNTKEALDYTEALNNALVVSGAKAQRAETVQNALSKAMAGGKLAGQNLNTIIEQGGRVAEALAEELGVSTLELRKLGADGKITSDVIYNALTKRMQELREEAEAMPATISDGFQQVANAVQRYIGQLDQASGTSAAFAEALVFMATHFDSIMAAATVAGVALTAQYIPALAKVVLSQAAVVATNPFLLLVTAISAATFALSAFGDQFQPIEGEFANLQDYGWAAFDALKEGTQAVYESIKDYVLEGLNMITKTLGDTEVSWDDVWTTVKGVINNIIGGLGLLYDSVLITYESLPGIVAEKAIDAMNYMLEIVSSALNKIIDKINAVGGAVNRFNNLWGTYDIPDIIGTIDPVNLGTIENKYKGAGEAAGKAYGEALANRSKDYLGKLGEEWRKRANQIATGRQLAEDAEDPLDGLGGAGGGGITPGGGGGGKGKKGKSGKNKENDFQRQVAQIRERTAAIEAETQAQAGLNPLIDDYEYSVTKAKAAQELLSAAQKAGIEITPELKAQIDQLAESLAQATMASNQLAESQAEAKKRADELKGTAQDAMSGFIKDLKDGKKASDALASALSKVADKLFDMMLSGLFGGKGGLFGGLFSIFGFAQGGVAAYGKPQPMKTFARGGVSNTAAIFGEAGPEAAVPLPDGRRIPVDLNMANAKGGGQQDMNITIGVAADGNGNIKPFVQSIARNEASKSASKVVDKVPGMVDNRNNTRELRGTRG